MRKTKLLFPVLTVAYFILSGIHSFAQTDTGYYFFKEDFSYTGDTTAVNAGITLKEDSLWRLIVVNKNTNKVVMKGAYRANYLERPDGRFEYYYGDGLPLKSGSYHDGKETGLWLSWTHSGQLLDSFLFDEGEVKVFARYYYENDDQVKTYSYSNKATAEKIYKNYNSDGTLTEEAAFTGKAGQTKNYYPGGQLAERIVFNEKGNKTSVQHFTEEGKEISEKEYTKAQEKKFKSLIEGFNATIPEFKGGQGQFEMFLQKNLQLPNYYKESSHHIQSIQFSFMLDEKGKATNLKMINPADVELERSILELLRIMPPWDMKSYKSWGPVTHTIRIIG